MKRASIILRESQKATSITLQADEDSLIFLEGKESSRFHCFDWAFITKTYLYNVDPLNPTLI